MREAFREGWPEVCGVVSSSVRREAEAFVQWGQETASPHPISSESGARSPLAPSPRFRGLLFLSVLDDHDAARCRSREEVHFGGSRIDLKSRGWENRMGRVTNQPGCGFVRYRRSTDAAFEHRSPS